MSHESPRDVRAPGNLIGIMQGRLSPPRPNNPQYFPADRWQAEYEMAAGLGFDTIEWLYDSGSSSDNPILTAEGRDVIRSVQERAGITTASVCADYFKEHSLAADDSTVVAERSGVLAGLAEAAASIGATCLLVPLIEQAAVSTATLREKTALAMSRALDLAYERGVTIALETDLPAKTLGGWLEEIDHPALGVYYDLGNAVAYGYDPVTEIGLLKRWVKGVHVKDRVLGGPNVPLGAGAVDFGQAFSALAGVGYRGPLVLETIREEDYAGDARRHLAFVRSALATVGRAYSSTAWRDG